MMLRVAACRWWCELFPWAQAGRRRPLHGTVTRHSDQGASAEFDPAVLQYLVCPLSRKPLRSWQQESVPGCSGRPWLSVDMCKDKEIRYEEATKELINEELGIAYPVVDGIPNMTPQDARMIRRDQKPQDTEDKP